MKMLNQNGLRELNNRLKQTEKPMKIIETLAEHSLAVDLLRKNKELKINYEPPEFKKPPDFHVELDSMVFFLEVKRPGKLEMDGRREKDIEVIKKRSREIKIPRGFNCYLHVDFKNIHIDSLMSFIEDNANKVSGRYSFFEGENILATIEFIDADIPKLNHLVLYSCGDLNPVNVSEPDKCQLKKTMENAVNKFYNIKENKLINIISLELNFDINKYIDVCDVLYGGEYYCIGGKERGWTRDNDGLFNLAYFSKNVSGVLIRSRRKHEIICDDYRSILCVNERFSKETIKSVKRIMNIDGVVNYDTKINNDFFDAT